MNVDYLPQVSRAWYAASVAEFLQSPADLILGQLVTNCGFSIDPAQRDAWLRQIAILVDARQAGNGYLRSGG